MYYHRGAGTYTTSKIIITVFMTKSWLAFVIFVGKITAITLSYFKVIYELMKFNERVIKTNLPKTQRLYFY